MSYEHILMMNRINVALDECFRKPIVLNKNNDNETVEELEYIPIENTEKEVD